MKSRTSKRLILLACLCLLTYPAAASTISSTLGEHAPVAFSEMQQLSPDNQSVVYVTANNLGMTGSTIWVAKPDGSEKVAVAAGAEGVVVTSPVWSPDSQQIAYLKIIDTVRQEFDVVTTFELWVVNKDGSGDRRVTDSELLNPELEFGGKANIVWNTKGELEFSDHTALPVKRYAVNVTTGVIRELEVVAVERAASSAGIQFPLPVPVFKQCDSRWGSQSLGWCSTTVCRSGCAISAVSMVFAYYGANADPGKLNHWLKYNGGYASGCLIYWARAANYSSRVSYSAMIWGVDWNRIRWELDRCYPVIVEVDSPTGKPGRRHFVVVTGYSGNTFLINDSYANYTTLNQYNNKVYRMIIYRGPVNCCPNISLGGLPSVPCLPRDGSGIAYSAQLQASGGAAPYTFTLVSGSLPPGLTLSRSGRLSGTLNLPAVGTHTFTIKASDARGCGGTRKYTLKVEKCPCPPITLSTITQPACLPPDGTGLPYEQQVTAEGGFPPYTFSITDGALPSGLTLSPDGEITGVLDKTLSGTYSFEVTASDSCDCSATQVYPLELYSCSLEFKGWEIDINGTTYQNSDLLPGYVDQSAFDWDAGLGSLSLKFEPGAAGDYFINASFDYLFSSLFPERFDLTETSFGRPVEGQLLDMAIDEYDISAELGWEFRLTSDVDYAEITFVLGDALTGENGGILPYVGFAYNDRTDLSGNCKGELQFTSDAYVTPEPSTVALLGIGLISIFAWGHNRKRNNKQ